MSPQPPDRAYDDFNRLVRLCADPTVSRDVRGRAASEMAELPLQDLQGLAESNAFRRVLEVLDEPYRVEAARPGAEPSGDARREQRGLRGYGLVADLRVLLNAAFDPKPYRVAPEIERLRSLWDRARVCAAADQVDDLPPEELARGAAWTQVDPGTGLLWIRRASSNSVDCTAAYLDQALVRGAAGGSVPPLLAMAIVSELASRPAAAAWLDGVVRWMEAWVAAAPLEVPPSRDLYQRLRRVRLLIRAKIALRALSAEVRSPRLLALSELMSAVTLIRAAGRADLVRAFREAGEEPEKTSEIHVDHDRRAELCVENAIGVVLGRPSESDVDGLTDRERGALAFVEDIVAADVTLAEGLLPKEG